MSAAVSTDVVAGASLESSALLDAPETTGSASSPARSVASSARAGVVQGSAIAQRVSVQAHDLDRSISCCLRLPSTAHLPRRRRPHWRSAGGRGDPSLELADVGPEPR